MVVRAHELPFMLEQPACTPCGSRAVAVAGLVWNGPSDRFLIPGMLWRFGWFLITIVGQWSSVMPGHCKRYRATGPQGRSQCYLTPPTGGPVGHTSR